MTLISGRDRFTELQHDLLDKGGVRPLSQLRLGLRPTGAPGAPLELYLVPGRYVDVVEVVARLADNRRKRWFVWQTHHRMTIHSALIVNDPIAGVDESLLDLLAPYREPESCVLHLRSLSWSPPAPPQIDDTVFLSRTDEAVRMAATWEALRLDPVPDCPHCAEPIKSGALVCPHCGREVVADENTA